MNPAIDKVTLEQARLNLMAWLDAVEALSRYESKSSDWEENLRELGGLQRKVDETNRRRLQFERDQGLRMTWEKVE
jgi:hypothetical protein